MIISWNRVFTVAWALLFCGGVGLTHTAAAQENAATESSPEALRVYEGARNAQSGNSFELAAEEWGRFLKMFPRDPLVPKVRYYQSVCHLQLRKWDPAMTGFAQVIKDHPKFEMLEDTYLNLGWCQFSAAEEGKAEMYAAAAKTFEDMLQKFPKGSHRDEALYFLGDARYLQGQRGPAIAAYQVMIEEFPQSRLRCNALYALGVAHEEEEQFAEAGRAYDLFLESCSEHQLTAEVRMRKAETLLQTGAVEEAEKLFAAAAAIADFAFADHALYRRGVCLSRLEKFAEAADVFVRIVRDMPDSTYVPDAEISAGRAYQRLQQWDAATQWLEAARKRGGDRGLEATHWLCRIKIAQDQAVAAEQLAAQALPQASQSAFFADLRMDHADAMYEQPDKRSQALVLYLKIAEDHDDHRLAPQALYNASFAALELKDYDMGLKLAQQFLGKYPDDRLVADVRTTLVECHLQKRQYEEAQQELTRLISDNPQRPERDAWRLRLGLVQYLKGDYAAAADYLADLATQLADPPLVAEAQYLAGLCHFFRDQFDDSAAALEASLQASREWRQVADTMLVLARCRHKQGRLDEALQLAQEVITKHGQSSVIDQAHYRLGEFQYAAEKYDQSQQAYMLTVKNWPDSSFAAYALYGQGWTHIKLQQFPQAVATFTSFIDKHPQHELHDDSLLARAMARRQAGEHAAAIADFNAYLQSNPPEPGRSDALYERGLAEVAAKQWPAAVATLTSILDQNPQYVHADKVLYELGWAHRGAKQEDEAVAQFTRLAAEHAESPLAAESLFHVGEHQYQQEKYDDAIKSYTAATTKAQLGELKEKSLYKLGWSHFQLQAYEPALARFNEQSKAFPDGVLFADAVFMTGECQFKLERYEPALASFASVQVLKPSSEQMEMLALLHGGQSAGQLKKWNDSVKQLDQLITKFPQSGYLAEAHYERGWAKQNLNQLDAALADYEKAADERSALGARARFMMGEVRFGKKEFADAVREFQRAMFLYGGEEAPDEIKVWQAKAGFEAGRCSEVLIQNATNAEDKAMAIADAKKFYSFVVQKHANNALAAEAKKRLAAVAGL